MCHTRRDRDLEQEARKIVEGRLMEEEIRRREEHHRRREKEESPTTEKVEEMAGVK